MNVFIEKYRGVEIIFNTENERFSFSFDEGTWREKQSYAACKKNIDDYFKANQNFKPFQVRRYNDGSQLNIVGIRKDNRFICYKNGKNEQVSEYEEQYYIEVNPEHDAIYAEIAKLEKEAKGIENKISELRKTITGKTLKEIKTEII